MADYLCVCLLEISLNVGLGELVGKIEDWKRISEKQEKLYDK